MITQYLPLLTLPPVSWWIEAVRLGRIPLVTSYKWEKQTLRNRYVIGGPNDRQILSVPVYKPSRSEARPMMDVVKVAYDEAWVRDHQRSIEAAYRKSPYFDYYFENLFEILNSEKEMLNDLSIDLLRWALKAIDLDLKIEIITEYNAKEVAQQVKSFGKETNIPNYHQVFEDRFSFRKNMSVMDLIFNLGPEAAYYLADSV